MTACRVRVVLALLASFLIHLPAPPARAQSSSIIKKQPIGKAVPAWVAKPPADDAKDLMFVGTATSASEPQARNNAFDDAAAKAVVRIGTELFQDSSVLTWYGLDALRDYVRKVGKIASQDVRPNSGGGYTAYVLLQLNRAFVVPTAVRQYAAPPVSAQQQSRPTAMGYLLVPSNVGTAAVTKRTQVRMPNLRQGNFYFYFNLAANKGQLWIRLDQLQVLDDGSAASTRWQFDVFVNGKKSFSVPAASYSDDVVSYRMRAGDRTVETRVSAGTGLTEIRISGSRIEAAKAR